VVALLLQPGPLLMVLLLLCSPYAPVLVALPLLLFAGQDSTRKRHSVWLRLLWSLYAVVPTCVTQIESKSARTRDVNMLQPTPTTTCTMPLVCTKKHCAPLLHHLAIVQALLNQRQRIVC
jgi:hypothetical protein